MRIAALMFVGIAAGLFFSGAASADTITLNTEFSGATASSGAPTITFTDTGLNEVTMTMSAANLTGTEFIRDWLFNSSLDPSLFTFQYVSGDVAVIDLAGTFNVNDSDLKADGDGYFDVKFDFQAAGDLDAGQSSVYKITGSGISVSTFLLGSAPGGGNGTWMSAAHVQGIGVNGGFSGWMGGNVTHSPEPGTIFLLGAAGAGLMARRRARKRRTA